MNRYNWKGYDFVGTVPDLQKSSGTARPPPLSMPSSVFPDTDTTAWTLWSKGFMRKNGNGRSEPTASI